MLRIISWNVNGIRAWYKKGKLEWLLEESPDMFCIQETKAEYEQLPEELKNIPGYTPYFDHSKGRKGYSGVAIYTKIKPEKVDYALGVPELDQEGRFIALHFKDFTLINTYFPNGGGGPIRLAYKLEYYDAFLKYVNKLTKKGVSVVFCGDINTAHTEIDLARPKENVMNTGFLPIERAWLDKVVEHGFIDTFRLIHGNIAGAYTYWDMKTFARDRNVGWRIDYFFVSPDLKDKVKKAEILNEILGSDHCPLEISLAI
jgi:exodeoxyribonuclease-3